MSMSYFVYSLYFLSVICHNRVPITVVFLVWFMTAAQQTLCQLLTLSLLCKVQIFFVAAQEESIPKETFFPLT